MYILENPNAVPIGYSITMSIASSAGLPITVESSAPDVCTASTVDNNTVITTIAAGTCIVVAFQAGDSVTESAEQVIRDFEVVKIPQKISFNNPGAINLVGGKSVNFPLNVKEDYSTATPTITSDTPLVCSVTGATGTAITTGTCRLTATLDEDTTHAAAIPVTVEFDIRGTEPGEKIISVVVPQSQIVAGTITNQYAIK